MSFTYLDWASTALPDSEGWEYALRTARDTFGNPSSLHAPGKEAGALLKESRAMAASLLGCETGQIFFTSGGSESNTLVFSQLLLKPNKGNIVTSAIEHPSVHETAAVYAKLGFRTVLVPSDAAGLIDPEAVAKALVPETQLISIMAVNNETGTIQDIGAITEAVRETRKGKKVPHIHTDAVQALGKGAVDLKRLGVDSASFSGHKIGAPRGVGILYIQNPRELFFKGGGQEGGIRPGTENLPGIAAFALVMKKRLSRLDETLARAGELKLRLVEGLRGLPGTQFLPLGISPTSEHMSPFILKCSFPPIPGEVLQRVLNDRGFAVSTGSACSSNTKRTNRVLRAMGVPAESAESSIRVSWGPETTNAEIDALVATLKTEVTTLKEQLR